MKKCKEVEIIKTEPFSDANDELPKVSFEESIV